MESEIRSSGELALASGYVAVHPAAISSGTGWLQRCSRRAWSVTPGARMSQALDEQSWVEPRLLCPRCGRLPELTAIRIRVPNPTVRAVTDPHAYRRHTLDFE